MNAEEFVAALDRLKAIMVSVSTGGDRIGAVQGSFTELYDRISVELERRGLGNPLPYRDLWEWYGHFSSGELPSWQARRHFVNELFRPLLRQVRGNLGRLNLQPNVTEMALLVDQQWDVFVSHAGEDKDDFARPLASRLRELGLRVWFDEFTLTIGDSLRRSIDKGLAGSQFGVVVLSPAFLRKHWPQLELDGLAAREVAGVKVILPIWHNVDIEDIRRVSPMLADRLAVSSATGIDNVADELLRVVRPDLRRFNQQSGDDGDSPVAVGSGTPHLPSPELGESVKALIPSNADRIKLHDLVNRTVQTALRELGSSNFPPDSSTATINVDFVSRVRRYDDVTADLQTISALLAYWGTGDQIGMLAGILSRLAEFDRPRAGLVLWLRLAAYPILSVMYAGGIAALAAGRYDMLRACLSTPVCWDRVNNPVSKPIVLSVADEITEIVDSFKLIPGLQQKHAPRSEHQYAALQAVMEREFFLGARYRELFDNFEIMLALTHADLYAEDYSIIWGMPGRFAFVERSIVGQQKPFSNFVDRVRTEGPAWPGFAAGFFRGSLTRFEEVARGYGALLVKAGPLI